MDLPLTLCISWDIKNPSILAMINNQILFHIIICTGQLSYLPLSFTNHSILLILHGLLVFGCNHWQSCPNYLWLISLKKYKISLLIMCFSWDFIESFMFSTGNFTSIIQDLSLVKRYSHFIFGRMSAIFTLCRFYILFY